MYSVGIITLSDSRDNVQKRDESGLFLKDSLTSHGLSVSEYVLLKDERDDLRKTLLHFTDDLKLNLVITTGGTGLAPRDITPETTEDILDKEVPGIMEWLRHQSMAYTKRAVLSRGVAGIRKGSLIINLPGSLKAVQECMEELWDLLPHALDSVNGNTKECGR